MTYGIEFTIEPDGIAIVSLNRPDKLNALDLKMYRDLAATIKLLRKNKVIRVVIVKGNGDDFCSGIDVKSLLTNKVNGLKLLWKWLPGNANLAQQVSAGFRKINVPVIFAIHGRCWGGGMQLALGGDYRIASPEASLSIMEGKWGIIPDMGGTLGLREFMPVDHAMKLAMTAEEIDANRSLELGLISEIADDPLDAAKALAKQLILRSPDSLAAVKKLYHKAWHTNDRSILSKETRYQWRILLGKNQSIAVKKAKGYEASYQQRMNW
jgi:enoyl-CoA hydratase/carnithine racemase